MKKNLRVLFVGNGRHYATIPEGYLMTFVKYHAELPYYYARYSRCDVDMAILEMPRGDPQWENAGVQQHDFTFLGGGHLRVGNIADFSGQYDVVVHWRKWFPEHYRPEARNVILSQDHSYSDSWKSTVDEADSSGQLDGILVFPTWHRAQVAAELSGIVHSRKLYPGMTLGVDTDVYYPMKKDPFHLLWASDPGRGLERLIDPFLTLWSRDRRYHLTVTYPDYVGLAAARYVSFLSHPGVRHEPGLRNGQKLWDLFNTAAFLPYSSTFPEPSSRCHRQAQAAGCVVLYPPHMGTPSELIENGLTGIIDQPEAWPDLIRGLTETRRDEIGQNARALALSENWAVQATRFHDFFSSEGQ